jgi:hypothetical protein
MVADRWPLCLGAALSVISATNIVQNGTAALYSTRGLSSSAGFAVAASLPS